MGDSSVDEIMRLTLLERSLLTILLLILAGSNLASSVNAWSNVSGIRASLPLPLATPSMPLPAAGYTPRIVPVSGVIRVLVVAVTFSDINYTLSIAQIENAWSGIVPAYYREISYGKLIIKGDVRGWYKLPYPESHYGRDCLAINDADCSGVNQSWQIAVDAVPLAEKSVNFSNYDYYVFIHSGRGQETSQVKNDIWSVTYLDASVKTNSKTLTRFNIVPELEEPPNVPNGVWCLEFAHDLGVPDLYNTANGPEQGKPILGPWELMDKGSWNGDPPGSLPAHMTAWPKTQLGFISGSMLAYAPHGVSAFTVDPTEIVSSKIHAIKIPFGNVLNSTTYYLVEVRQRVGFDSALPAVGVLITYVNETTQVGKVHVVNGDPGVADLTDAVWRVGGKFIDKNQNLTVAVTGTVGSSFQITVIRGSTTPALVGPLTRPTTQTIREGVTFAFEVAWNMMTQENVFVRSIFPSFRPQNVLCLPSR